MFPVEASDLPIVTTHLSISILLHPVIYTHSSGNAKIDNALPLSVFTDVIRPISANHRRIEAESVVSEMLDRKRAKSAQVIRDSRPVIDEVSTQEAAFGAYNVSTIPRIVRFNHSTFSEKVSDEFNEVLKNNKSKLWLPVSSPNDSQHRNQKNSALAFGIRHKAWKRAPWPDRDTVDIFTQSSSSSGILSVSSSRRSLMPPPHR